MSSTATRIDLQGARMSLALPFIAAVAMTMVVRIEKCGTAATNGVWVQFDPDFVESLTDAELMFLYAHETLHKAFLHKWRRGTRNPEIWNHACDYVINGVLVSMNNTSINMPKGGLHDHRFDGMSEEAVYDKLLSEGATAPQGFKPDMVDDDERTMADVEVEIHNIAAACQMAGSKDGMLETILKNAAKSKVRWEDVLRQFVNSNIRSGSTWKRPSRRSEAAGVYLPSLRSKTIGSIVLFGDVSGSMVPLLQRITNEMQGVIDEVSPEYTHVICGDTRVRHVESFERGARISLSCKAGGGTDFRPLFEEVEARGWQPDCAVFLTDTYGTFPAAAPNYPVIWGVLGANADRVSVPWGEKVGISE